MDETEVSKVMPEINSLTYRGYAAQDLCARCNFEEVAYLILNGDFDLAADINSDSTVNVLDVIQLVNIILVVIYSGFYVKLINLVFVLRNNYRPF